MIYPHRCGHCKNLAPEWAKAATELKGKFKLGALDATVHTVMAGRYDIRGFPTIKYFPGGKKDFSSAEDYDGGRTSGDIVQWASNRWTANLPPPEIFQVRGSHLSFVSQVAVTSLRSNSLPVANFHQSMWVKFEYFQ